MRQKAGLTKEKAERIIEAFAEGGRLKKLIRDAAIPMLDWIRLVTTDDTLASMMEEARRVRAQMMADEIVAISDGRLNRRGEDGRYSEERDKMRMKARMWAAEKYDSELFGRKINHKVSGTLDLRPIVAGIQQVKAELVSPGHSATRLLPASKDTVISNTNAEEGAVVEEDDDIFAM